MIDCFFFVLTMPQPTALLQCGRHIVTTQKRNWNVIESKWQNSQKAKLLNNEL